MVPIGNASKTYPLSVPIGNKLDQMLVVAVPEDPECVRF